MLRDVSIRDFRQDVQEYINKNGLDINKDSLILETKYSKISYIPSNGEFLVENDGKYGIIEVHV